MPIAYGRPTNIIGLERFNYFIPVFLETERNSDYVEDMFSIVLAAGKDADKNSILTNLKIRFYSDRKLNSQETHLDGIGDELIVTRRLGPIAFGPIGFDDLTLRT